MLVLQQFLQVDGERTLAENLADNGGLHHAYRAYRRFLARHGPEPTLPGFEDYSAEQLFFIAFGNVSNFDLEIVNSC